MKKRVIALALVIVMIFALCACGKKEAAEVPLPQQEQPAGEVQVVEGVDVAEVPTGVAPNSGVYTYEGQASRIAFDYDSRFVAMENQAGNAVVYAGQDTGIPFCVISLNEFTDAESYLEEMAAAAATELGDEMKTQPGEPKKLEGMGERDIYYIYFNYEDPEAGGLVACAYYAENLEGSMVVVYNTTALADSTADVDGILALALQTFHLL